MPAALEARETREYLQGQVLAAAAVAVVAQMAIGLQTPPSNLRRLWATQAETVETAAMEARPAAAAAVAVVAAQGFFYTVQTSAHEQQQSYWPRVLAEETVVPGEALPWVPGDREVTVRRAFTW